MSVSRSIRFLLPLLVLGCAKEPADAPRENKNSAVFETEKDQPLIEGTFESLAVDENEQPEAAALRLREVSQKLRQAIVPVPENEEFTITDSPLPVIGGGYAGGTYHSFRMNVSLRSISYDEFMKRFESRCRQALEELGFELSGVPQTLIRGHIVSFAIDFGRDRIPIENGSPGVTVHFSQVTVSGVFHAAITEPGESEFEILVFAYEHAK
ncbi:MAG: hypothetical protein R3F19_04785 [Verrucomicrobiales bacterium]